MGRHRGCYKGLTAIDRFWSFVKQLGDCWIWQGATSFGYGRFCVGPIHPKTGHHGHSVYAHVFSYEIAIGPIPAGLQLDHICRNRACVRPSHLEPVTAKINVLRGNTIVALNASLTHCRKGHPFTQNNTRVYRRKRICRACHANRERERRSICLR